MARRILAVLLMLALLAPPVQATTSLCRFDVPEAPGDYDIDFVGGGEGYLSHLLFVTREGPQRMPIRLIAFDADRDQVDLIYENAGSSLLPPSFAMRGSGEHVGLFFRDSRVLVGELKCKSWEDDAASPVIVGNAK